MAASILMMMISSLLGEFLSLGVGALRCPGLAPIVSVAEGEPVSFECPFPGPPTLNNTFHEIIWLHTLSHTNLSKRILSIRMTRPNDSATVTVTEGHLRGQLDFEKHMSFLSIPEAGQPKSPLNLPQLFWIHELSGQAQFRLIAWHGLPQRDGTYCGTGSRFHSQLDLDKHRSYLTITDLEVNDSGRYHCEGLGHPGRGSSTSLIVKAPMNTVLISGPVAGILLFLLALCLCFKFRNRIHAKNQEVSLEMSQLNSNTPAPAGREPLTQPVSGEIIYSHLRWSKNDAVSSLGRSPHSEDPGAKKKSRKGTDGSSGTDVQYAVVGETLESSERSCSISWPAVQTQPVLTQQPSVFVVPGESITLKCVMAEVKFKDYCVSRYQQKSGLPPFSFCGTG
ncbi:hypothetical protein Y1Q_0022724 [Alligator mississippiensis]|uniref:Ig-like domain-containing protein n=1 Tax=Alligator mississippiensis TaxID=8496 RepID=A0A151N450_ALLMI|nr:hypothetical protein Y1Q_0022724 [Alligator mississippiensis]